MRIVTGGNGWARVRRAEGVHSQLLDCRVTGSHHIASLVRLCSSAAQAPNPAQHLEAGLFGETRSFSKHALHIYTGEL